MPRSLFLAALLAVSCSASIHSAGIEREKLLADCKFLSADDMQGRKTGTPAGEKARAYVVKRFKESGVRPFGDDFLQRFDVNGKVGANVVGQIGTGGGKWIVVSAHYDHIGVIDGQIYNGADDNASGAAALFALAQHFRDNPLKHRLLFVEFDGEEMGCLGSSAFIRKPPVPLSDIDINVNIDMVGRDKNNVLYTLGTYHYPFLKPYLDEVAKRAKVKMKYGYEKPGDAEDWTTMSDQVSFHAKHIPYVFFSVEDFENHHKATDDFATLTEDFFFHSVEAAADTIETLDKAVFPKR
jgi:Zn-dependent M28 family amino/carboxypeptidase